MGLAQPLDLNLADSFADPFRSPRLGGAEEDFRGGLREHGLGIFPVAGLHLAASLKAKDDRVLRFAILGDGGMKLRQPLQAGQLVDDEPDRFLVRHGLVQEAQNERVNPQTDERAKRLAHGWARRDEDPTAPRLCPIGRCPDRGCLVLLGQKPEAVRAHIERTKNPCPLLRGLRIDQHPILGSFDAPVDFGWIGHPSHQFFRRRKVGKEVCEYLLRSFHEEAIRDAFGLVKRHGQCLGLGFAA